MGMNATDLRVVERASIEHFVLQHSDLLVGEVLDFGCGKQPYRSIVEGVGGSYTPYDRVSFPGSTVTEDVGAEGVLGWATWDAILCNQVIQYVPLPRDFLTRLYTALRPGGWLVMTGPTNWPEVEKEDLFRYTIAGVKHLLQFPWNWSDVEVVEREAIRINDFGLSLGWGAIAKARA